jgi:hypothetical protein
MRKLLGILMALVIVAVFSFGCAGVSKESKVKCPKCGAVFSVDEGLGAYQGGK